MIECLHDEIKWMTQTLGHRVRLLLTTLCYLVHHKKDHMLQVILVHQVMTMFKAKCQKQMMSMVENPWCFKIFFFCQNLVGDNYKILLHVLCPDASFILFMNVGCTGNLLPKEPNLITMKTCCGQHPCSQINFNSDRNVAAAFSSADSFSSRFYIFQSKSILKSVCGHTDSYLQKWILKDSYRSLTCKNELMLLLSGDWVLESLHGLHAFWHKTLPSIRIIFLFILSTCECNAISILTKHLSHLWSLLSQVEIQQQQ